MSWNLIRKENNHGAHIKTPPYTKDGGDIANMFKVTEVTRDHKKNRPTGEFVYFPRGIIGDNGERFADTSRFYIGKDGVRNDKFLIQPTHEKNGYRPSCMHKKLRNVPAHRAHLSVGRYYLRRTAGFGLVPGFYEWHTVTHDGVSCIEAARVADLDGGRV